MSKLQSIQDLFTHTMFRIPMYQRGYSWGKEQLIEFWEDLNNIPLDAQNSQSKGHYTGMISIKKVKEEEWKDNEKWNDEQWMLRSGTTAYYVVDGQQRLTTIIIAIFEIYKLIEKAKENEGKSQIDKRLGSYKLYDIEKDYLRDKENADDTITTYKFGYEKDNDSFKYFKNIILEENINLSVEETSYTINLQNAKIFFRDNINDLYNEKGIKGVEDLFVKITQKLKFDRSEIDDDFNEYVAFETINNRGKRLSNLELLKNRLMYLVSLYDETECDKEHKASLHKSINETWGTIYKYLGKSKKVNDNSDDELLYNHWIVYFGYNRARGEAYREFLLYKKFTVQNIFEKVTVNTKGIKEIDDFDNNTIEQIEELDEEIENKDEEIKEPKLKPKEILDYITSLSEMAPIWYKIHNTKEIENEDEKKWLEKLNRIGFTQFKPLIAVTYLRKDISDDDRIALFEELERYIFLAFITGGVQSSFGNSEFFKLANQIYKGEADLQNVYDAMTARLKNWLIDENGFYKKGPLQNKIDNLFNKREGYFSWNGLKYFLYEYELKLMEDKTQVVLIDWEKLFKKSRKDEFSIEHIYPQTPEDEDWINKFDKFDEKQQKYLTHSLGNLLALSRSKNSSLQNDKFSDKRDGKYDEQGELIRNGYKDGSYQEREVAKNETWTSKEILDRGMELLKFMEDRWNIKFKSEEEKKELLYWNEITKSDNKDI